jgi:hypothetical protein
MVQEVYLPYLFNPIDPHGRRAFLLPLLPLHVVP